MWFDARELEKVSTTATKELRPPADAEPCERTCPHCRELMRRFAYLQTMVTVEVCPKCAGLWLDAGEFNEIKKVREHRRRACSLEEYAPVSGFKGKLLAWIDETIDSMKPTH